MQNNKEKKNVFEIENLSFAYDKHEVLNNLNLSFHEGIVTTMMDKRLWKIYAAPVVTEKFKAGRWKDFITG